MAFPISDRRVGDGHPCLVVAEVGQTHDGSLGIAHAFIDAIAKAGVVYAARFGNVAGEGR